MENSSLQLGVFRLGFFEDGDIGVGVLPEGKKILIVGLGFAAVAGDNVCPCHLQVGERT